MKTLIIGAIAAATVGLASADEARADHGRRSRGSFGLWIGNGGVSFGINRGYYPGYGSWGYSNFGRSYYGGRRGWSSWGRRGFGGRGHFGHRDHHHRGHGHHGHGRSRRGGHRGHGHRH